LSERRPSVLRETFVAGRTGARVSAGLIAALVLALGIGTNVGLEGPLALAGGLIAFIVVGVVMEVRTRRMTRELAFSRRDPPAYLDPITDFGIHPWLGGDSESELPPLVERRAMKRLMVGLREKRFAILTGPDESGKSRLAFEAAKECGEIALVAHPAPRRGEDPLISLMNDRRGFAAMEQDQVLLLTDLGARLSAGALSGESIRAWLDRNPRISVIAILDTEDLADIEEAGKAARDEMRRLRANAAMVPVLGRLGGEELVDAREKFPQIEAEQLPLLTSYLAAGTPLREALDEARVEKSLGYGLVCAIAGWRRAGILRPAPHDVVREVAMELSGEDGDFAQALSWALEPRGQAASLVYEVKGDQGSGYVPDNIVVGLFDDARAGREIPDLVWHAILRAVEARASDDAIPRTDIAAELLALGKAALIAERIEVAYPALAAVSGVGDPSQQRRAVEAVMADQESSLIDSRRGDGIIQRLKPVKTLAEGRRFLAGKPALGSSGDSRLIAWIYRRHSMRSFVRILVLAMADIFSTVVGLLVGLGLRALLTDSASLESEGGIAGSFIVLWAGITVFVFASARLYRKEVPRASIAGIAAAVVTFAVFGLASTLAEGFNVAVALAAAVGGGVFAFASDFCLRYAYDEVSRGWVRKHGLEARTLLIGPAACVAAVEAALDGMSRPSEVIGYLSDELAEDESEATPEAPLLGSTDDLGAIALRRGVGRVVISDPEMPPQERQALADRCHERGLMVEAVASVADIRMGSGTYILGQPLVLITLLPLWQRNTKFFLKRAMDFILSLLLLVALSPLFAIVWVLLRLEGKPVVVHSWRPGLGGESFHMYRFRTAVGERRSRMDLLDEEGEQPERTRLGVTLRDHGIDELPQLINILRGQMSLVGPRPLELHNHVRLSDPDLLRYVVRPGATGPWQVCSRTTLSYSELTSMDMAYLRRWSIFTDLEILARTAKLVLVGRDTVPAIAHKVSRESG
jgi:lipopolysaccharide/colanic/teichoic acid biosynthesis glycosyltransferase